jgi:hypothetical protein
MLRCLNLQSPALSATGCARAALSVTLATSSSAPNARLTPSKQFIEIQDSIWAETDETSESSDGTDKPADL